MNHRLNIAYPVQNKKTPILHKLYETTLSLIYNEFFEKKDKKLIKSNKN